MERELYGPLDDAGAAFAEELKHIVAHGGVPDFGNVKPFAAQLVYNMIKRSMDFWNLLDFIPRSRSILGDLVKDFETNNKELPLSEREEFFRDESVREHLDYVRSASLAQQTPAALLKLQGYDFAVGAPHRTNS